MAKRYFRYDAEQGKVVEVEKTVTCNLPRYPFPCEALAVHPDQIGEYREHAEKMGVSTDFRPDGSPIMRDKGHYKNYRKMTGTHFRNGIES